MDILFKEFDILSVKDKFREIILNESHKDYFKGIFEYLKEAYERYNIFPKKEDVFNAFKNSDFYDIKAIILGQDPYYREGQSHGLPFSICNPNMKISVSLRNIFKELKCDLNIENEGRMNLTPWAKEGVLLMNTTLTVREGHPNSHRDIGWRIFTDKMISMLSEERENLVFILWGNFAIKKEELIDKDKHLIIKSPHPSGHSAHRGFFGSKPFSRTNNYLKEHKIEEINWRV